MQTFGRIQTLFEPGPEIWSLGAFLVGAVADPFPRLRGPFPGAGKDFHPPTAKRVFFDDLRVLDYNGHSVFYNFLFSDMGPFIYREEPQEAKKP
jgi:hypothetical protein